MWGGRWAPRVGGGVARGRGPGVGVALCGAGSRVEHGTAGGGWLGERRAGFFPPLGGRVRSAVPYMRFGLNVGCTPEHKLSFVPKPHKKLILSVPMLSFELH